MPHVPHVPRARETLKATSRAFLFLEVVKSHAICHFSLEASRPGKLAKLGVVSCPVFEWHEWHE